MKGDDTGAAADYDRLVELGPKDAFAYNTRGVAKRDQGNRKGAEEDFSRAVELSPKNMPAWRNRAYLRYDNQAWTDSLTDFRRVQELRGKPDPYCIFHIWLIRVRLGEGKDATGELRQSLKTASPDDLKPWHRSIAAFLLDEISEEDLLKAAEVADAKITRDNRCEGYFQIASKRLIAGNKTGAMEAFKKCVETGVKGFFEYRSALTELKRLEQ
jgi:lipoprotein NlpI